MTMPVDAGYDCGFISEAVPEDRLSIEVSACKQYAVDASAHEPCVPDAVVWPQTTAEVAAIVRMANERGVPVTPWSGGTSLEGNPIPIAGGVVLNVYEMDRVEVRPDDLQAVVEPGVVYNDLNETLASHGVRFPPGISSADSATIGGMIANNASGINAVGYGETRDHVLRLEVVLPDGEVIHCGRDVIKTSAGYSLKDLFVGSEGTLGVVTEATLSVAGIPERTHTALVTFPTRRDASTAVAEIIRFGLHPGAVEFIDRESIRLINAFHDEATLPQEPLLIVELHGNNSGIEEDIEFVRSICEDRNARKWIVRSGKETTELWAAREDALPAYRAYREHWDVALLGDVVVPISKYPDIVEVVGDLAEEFDICTPCVGHAGDGNLHYVPLVDHDDEAALDDAFELNEQVIERAIDFGGTATGEHGVGIGKQKFMRKEHGGALDLMTRLKRTIDPNGIMNPGKVLPEDE